MKKDKAHLIAFIGVMSALIFVMFLLESMLLAGVGMTACILSLPMAIALSVYDDWKKSFIGGTILGCCSCIFCLMYASMFLTYANPLISILPRTFIGITAYWSMRLFSHIFRNCKSKYLRETLPASIGGVIGSMTNTVLYLLAVNIWSGNFLGSFTAIVSVALTIYFPIELAACFILVPVYVAVMRKVTKRGVVSEVAPEPQEELNDNMS